MDVIWTDLARITFFEITENLKRTWTRKEVKNFISLCMESITNIQHRGMVAPGTNNYTWVRKVVIHKNVSLFYKEDMVKKRIYLLVFFNNRMDPDFEKVIKKGIGVT